MWRYYLIATVIVVAFGSAVFAERFVLHGWNVQPDAKGPPRASRRAGPNEGFVTTPEPFFRGQGGWVLSALPGCFEQLSSIEGSSQALVFHVPPARARVPPGRTLQAGNCTLLVRPHDVWVYRGADRLRVPPEARVYTARAGLTLVYAHSGHTEVRIYRRISP